jgi:hypothetical protein
MTQILAANPTSRGPDTGTFSIEKLIGIGENLKQTVGRNICQ